MLSFVYSMLTKDLLAALVAVGFDPYMGFYHQPRYGRPALDLMEEFRPLVGDSVVIGLVNNGEIRPGDFVARAGAVSLTSDGRKRVIEAYERRLDLLVTHLLFGYAIGYRRVFEVQARLPGRIQSVSTPIAARPHSIQASEAVNCAPMVRNGLITAFSGIGLTTICSLMAPAKRNVRREPDVAPSSSDL